MHQHFRRLESADLTSGCTVSTIDDRHKGVCQQQQPYAEYSSITIASVQLQRSGVSRGTQEILRLKYAQIKQLEVLDIHEDGHNYALDHKQVPKL